MGDSRTITYGIVSHPTNGPLVAMVTIKTTVPAFLKPVFNDAIVLQRRITNPTVHYKQSCQYPASSEKEKDHLRLNKVHSQGGD